MSQDVCLFLCTTSAPMNSEKATSLHNSNNTINSNSLSIQERLISTTTNSIKESHNLANNAERLNNSTKVKSVIFNVMTTVNFTLRLKAQCRLCILLSSMSQRFILMIRDRLASTNNSNSIKSQKIYIFAQNVISDQTHSKWSHQLWKNVNQEVTNLWLVHLAQMSQVSQQVKFGSNKMWFVCLLAM